MVTPNDIKDQCLKWWKDVLVSTVNGKDLFPKEIARIGKISSKDILAKLSDYKSSIQTLRDNSKEYKGFGYRVILVEKHFEKIGRQQIPEKICVETRQDYLRLISREKDYNRFLANFSLIKSELPQLIEWIKSNPLKLVEHDTWADTIKVCRYFIENPTPNLYIRQLPIDVHTKYIQTNKSLIQALLEFLIPNSINSSEMNFELRFNLRCAEPLIRTRFLDQRISPVVGISDISLPLSEFSGFEFPCKKVFITENLMNFLTLPSLSETISIWSGGGFNVSYLKGIEWLTDKSFYYWGDIDAQGFQILNQFRTYFPSTKAVMMDEKTLNLFPSGSGVPSANQNLPMLTNDEFKLYQHLREANLRLEQEKNPQSYAEAQIYAIVNSKETVFENQ
ncbi:MAG TPA: Wadjet anti-phage system protein JetD domain-containing protein [Flavisolibacter sp.]|nr:Wadjet anti-phage system protein JetD domain-containing protein [Flavisolibacter sp.]